jgi:3',5'-cyclic-AMP phosphodiesterase
MITSPADRRLAIGPHPEANIRQVRASAWGAAPIAQAEFRIDDQEWLPMYGGDGGQFGSELMAPDGLFRLSVRVTDQQGDRDTDTIEVAPYRPMGRQPTGAMPAALVHGRNGIFSAPNWDRIGTAGNGERLLTTILAQRKF